MRRVLALWLVALLGAFPAVALVAAFPGAAQAAGAGTKTSSPAATSTASAGKQGQTSPVGALPGSTSPFSPGVPIAPTTTPTATTPTVTAAASTSSSSDSGLSGHSAIAIAVGAIIVLSGISYFIWRDARRHAPVRGTAGVGPAGVGRATKAPPKPRKLSPAERRRRKRGRARR